MIYYLDLFGIAVFAIAGVIAAERKQMDVFGAVVVAIVTGIGGGTLRDVLLGLQPVFWIVNPTYIIVAILAAIATFTYTQYGRVPIGSLRIADAFGLALFTVLGCERALAVDAPVLIVVLMGTITGVAGGVIRDLLCGEIPLILRREIYATASLLGGTIYVLLNALGVAQQPATMIAIGIVLVTRLSAIYWQLSLPTLKHDENHS